MKMEGGRSEDLLLLVVSAGLQPRDQPDDVAAASEAHDAARASASEAYARCARGLDRVPRAARLAVAKFAISPALDHIVKLRLENSLAVDGALDFTQFARAYELGLRVLLFVDGLGEVGWAVGATDDAVVAAAKFLHDSSASPTALGERAASWLLDAARDPAGRSALDLLETPDGLETAEVMRVARPRRKGTYARRRRRDRSRRSGRGGGAASVRRAGRDVGERARRAGRTRPDRAPAPRDRGARAARRLLADVVDPAAGDVVHALRPRVRIVRGGVGRDGRTHVHRRMDGYRADDYDRRRAGDPLRLDGHAVHG